jgi:hypothetical protein
MDRVKG